MERNKIDNNDEYRSCFFAMDKFEIEVNLF